MEDSVHSPEEKAPEHSPEGEPKQEPSVSYEAYRKLLDEKKKLGLSLREKEESEKKRQEALLLEEGKLKEALELRDKELSEERSRRLALEERDAQAKKLHAVIKGLGVGELEDKWYGVIGSHIDDIKIDDDGQVDQKSVSDVVEGLKKTWPEMIKKPVSGMPQGSPPGGPQTITRSEWMKLSSKEMRKWLPHQIT